MDIKIQKNCQTNFIATGTTMFYKLTAILVVIKMNKLQLHGLLIE